MRRLTRSPNYYDLLMVRKDARPEDIEAAYKRLIRAYHPDANVGGRQDLASEMTKRLNEARDTLLSPEARRGYDAWLASVSAEEEAEEPDLTPEQAAAADEAWQEEVRRHEEESRKARPPKRSPVSWPAFRRLWPQRAPASKRYFVATRFILRVIEFIREDPRNPNRRVQLGALAWTVLSFLLLAAVTIDLATLPIVFFFLWPLPYDGRLLLPLALVLSGFIGTPRMLLIGERGSYLFVQSSEMIAFVQQHAWLARINAGLVAVEPSLLPGQRVGVSPLIMVFLGPAFNARGYLGHGAWVPVVAYGLAALAALAIPYRLWRLADRMVRGQLRTSLGRLAATAWKHVTALGSALRARVRPKGKAMAQAHKN